MLKVVYRFTTQDGSWNPNDGKVYTITKEAFDRYAIEGIPGAGGSTHIFVKVPERTEIVEFNTSDGKNPKSIYTNGKAQWVNFPMFHTSAYNPDRDEVGPWEVRIDGELVAQGLGLPFGWHVSTFLVVEEAGSVAPLPTPPSVGTPPTQAIPDKIELYINGLLAWRN